MTFNTSSETETTLFLTSQKEFGTKVVGAKALTQEKEREKEILRECVREEKIL